MQLVDCYISLMAYVRHFQRSPTGEPDVFVSQIDQLINSARSSALTAGYSSIDVEAALFAVAAWIDEIVLISKWSGATEWQRHLLQKRYFNVTNAGNTFFTRLSELSAEQLPVREIYYLCLAMGFVGRYGYDRDQVALAKIKSENLLLLLKNRDSFSNGAGELFFPDGFVAEAAPLSPQISTARWRWQFSTLTKSVVLIPIFVLVTLYGTYHLVIWQMASSILNQIP